MPSEVVTYELDDSTLVQFEVEPTDGFRSARADDQVAGRVRDAVEPAVAAAKEVLAKLGEIKPDQIELSFGIKVSGTANWLVAKAETNANFSVTLIWKPKGKDNHESGS